MKQLILTTLLLGFVVAGTLAQNPVCRFGYKKEITINGGQVTGGPHTDFPVLISHTDADLATAAGKVTDANGYDIVFADDNGNLLDFDMEHYDGATGEYVAWVQIPTLTNGTDVTIHMLYGKSTITTDQSSTTVWSDPGYYGVWHLHNDFNDRSGNGYNGTNNGSTDANGNGFTADGQDFQDPNDWIELNSGTSFPNISTGSFTITGWINTDDNTQGGQRVFCDDANNSTGGFSMSLGDGGTGRLRFYMRGTTPLVLDSPTNTILNNTWYHCAIVQDVAGTRRTIYVDGVQVANSTTATIPGSADAGNASIGGEVAAGESANRFDGTLDEIRAFNGVLSANWIATEYASQNQPTTTVGVVTAGDFYFIDTEEDIYHTSAASNDWDNFATTWDSGELPNGQFENVFIQHDVDVDGGSADYTVCYCNISNNGSGNSRLDVSSTRTLTIIEDLDIDLNGAGGANTSRANFTGSSTINVGEDVNMTNTNTTAAIAQLFGNTDGTMNITGDLNMTNTSTGGDINVDMNVRSDLNVTGNVDMTQTSGDDTQIIIDSSSTVNITGNVTMANGGGDDVRIRLNNNQGINSQCTIGGTLTINQTAGDDTQIISQGSSSLLNVVGNVTANVSGGGHFQMDIDGGTYDFDSDYTVNQTANCSDGRLDIGAGFNGNFNCDGNMTVNVSNGNNDHYLINVDDGTFTVDGNLDLNCTGGSNDTDIDIDVDNDAIFTVGMNLTADLTGGDDIEIDLGNGSAGSTAQLNVGGNCSLTQNIGSAGNIMRVLVNDDTRFNVTGNLNLAQSNTAGDLFVFTLNNTGRLDVDGNIDFAAAGSGDLELRANNTSEVQIEGNFDRTPSAFGELDMAVGATLEFNGTAAAQTFPEDAGGGGDIFDYGIVEINNSFGTAPQITMEAGTATVHGSIVFMDGIVSSGAANLLVVDAGAGASGASDNSHVDGLMRKVGTDPFEFPVGDLGVWAPIEIDNITVSVNFDAEYFFVEHADATVTGALAYRSKEEYWTLDPSAATQADVTLHWKDAARSGINSFTADLVVAHYNGVDWESYGQNAITPADPGDVTATGVTTFSPFTFGSLSVDINTNPLPIELLSFDATLEGSVVQLDWITATELDNDFFTIERSADGESFEMIGIVQGAGTSMSTLYYKDEDTNPLSGWGYYRLKQTDFDGSSTYSDVRAVYAPATQGELTLYPNPSSDGGFTIALDDASDLSTVEIRDALGRLISSNTFSGNQLIVEPGLLASGSYLIRVENETGSWNRKVIVR